MTEDLFDRLARQAIEQARDAANTEGYFTPTIEIEVDRATQPVSVTLRVIPGAPTRVASVTIDVTGPARDDRQYGDRTIARIRDEWLLARDDIFRQADWTNAKQRAVATLAANAYASAKLVDSKAEIDPETTRRPQCHDGERTPLPVRAVPDQGTVALRRGARAQLQRHRARRN